MDEDSTNLAIAIEEQKLARRAIYLATKRITGWAFG